MNVRCLGVLCAMLSSANAELASTSQEQLHALMGSKCGAECVVQLRFIREMNQAPAPGIEPGSQE